MATKEEVQAKFPTRRVKEYTISYPEETINLVVVSPTRAEVNKYMSEIADNSYQAQENFVVALVKSPERKELYEVLDRYPALVMKLHQKLEELAGFGPKVEEKKD